MNQNQLNNSKWIKNAMKFVTAASFWIYWTLEVSVYEYAFRKSVIELYLIFRKQLDRQYRWAVYHKYKIRGCSVSLEKLIIGNSSPKRRLLTTVKQGSVRENVAWLPTIDSTARNSAESRTFLRNYRNAAMEGF